MNTSRAGSNMPCSCIHRRRARATSARFCSAAYRVFFTADVAASEEPPHRAAAACDPAFAHRRDDLVQRKVRLVGNQTQQKLRMLLQRRDAAAAWLCCNAAGPLETLHPDHHDAGADSIAFGRLAPRGTGLHLLNHSGTQVDGIGLRHRSLQKTNQCRQTRSLGKRWESYRFEPSEICSRSNNTKAYPVVLASTDTVRPFRSVTFLTSGTVTRLKNPLSPPMKTVRSGLTWVGASPCPSI